MLLCTKSCCVRADTDSKTQLNFLSRLTSVSHVSPALQSRIARRSAAVNWRASISWWPCARGCSLQRHVGDTTGPFWLALEFNDRSDDDRKNTEAREDHTRQDSGISR